MFNSQISSASLVGPYAADPGLPEVRTFCVVCGHFGSDFVLRRSGLKCRGCVGKSANRHWVRLQHLQASELLSHATRARLTSDSLRGSLLGTDREQWRSSRRTESDELDSIPPDAATTTTTTTTTHASNSEVRTALAIQLPRSRGPSTLLSGAEGSCSSSRIRQGKPHIMDYIAHTACYQVAAAEVCGAGVLGSASDFADLSVTGTNEGSSRRNNTLSNLISPPVARPKARRAPALPPRKSIPLTHQIENGDDTARKEEDMDKLRENENDGDHPDATAKEDITEEQDKNVNNKEHSVSKVVIAIDDEEGPIDSAQSAPLSSNGTTGGLESDTNQGTQLAYAYTTVTFTVTPADESNEDITAPTTHVTPSPLLQSVSLPDPPKTPRGGDFLNLVDGSTDTVCLQGSPETQVNNIPARFIASGAQQGLPTPQGLPTQQQRSHVFGVSVSDTNENPVGASHSSAIPPAANSGFSSMRSSMDVGKSIPATVFARSKAASDPGVRRSKRVLSTSSVTQRNRVKTQEQSIRKQKGKQKRQAEEEQQQHEQEQQFSQADPVCRRFGRCERISSIPAISTPSSSSVSSSLSSSCFSLTSSNAEDSGPREVLTDEKTCHKSSVPMNGGTSSPCINIDRLCVTVEGPFIISPDEVPSATKGSRQSASYNVSGPHTFAPVPVPSAPGSKFTVTRYLSTHPGLEICGSLVTPRNGLDNRCIATSSSTTVAIRSNSNSNTNNSDSNNHVNSMASEDAASPCLGYRRRNVIPPGDIKGKELTFILLVQERDSKTDLYSLERRYFADLAPSFHELKSLMHTLPPAPPRRIPGARYLTEGFKAELRTECQVFLDAVVQNHFLIRHPKIVELLSFEPYLVSANVSQRHPLRSHILQQHEKPGIPLAAHSSLRANLMSASSQLNENALDVLRSMSFTNRFDRQMSLSSCLSTTSSVNRRGAIDSINLEDLEKVRLGNLIGRGTFGTVYLGLIPGYSTVVAVKVVQVNENVDEDFLYSMQKELDILRAARHKNIIRFLGSTYFEHERELRVFTEYVECGNISTMVKKFGSLPMTVIQKYMIQILRGLHYLHSMSILHRDVKGENILVTKKGRCKLADFGCSGPLHGVEQREGVQGSPLWMAPEVIHGAAPGMAADVWAVGCVGIEMLQRPLWNIRDDLNPYVFLYRVGKMNVPPHGLPTEAEVQEFGKHLEQREEYECFRLYRDFLCRCLRMRMEERQTAVELLQHPFLRKHFSKHLRWMPPPVEAAREEDTHTATKPETEMRATPPCIGTGTETRPVQTIGTETTVR